MSLIFYHRALLYSTLIDPNYKLNVSINYFIMFTYTARKNTVDNGFIINAIDSKYN